MTRGNPRPGQQQMPDRSDEVERLALKAKVAVTKVTEDVRDAAEEMIEKAREVTEEAGKRLRAARVRAARKLDE